ncbi:MAG: InlB B-repeat-containing protein [Clostridiales bacterium]|nr:InlB B-repeat-containing protein [Clostridiales bacterium]
MRLVRNESETRARGANRSRRGFTLVELIVVLTILAILAAIGVASTIGYINRSRYDENEQNAITVYQTAQTAISQMVDNGMIDEWVEENFCDTGLFPKENELMVSLSTPNANTLNNPNDSYHKLVALTYYQGNTTGNALYDLLSTYFYDRTIFGGTMTVVFDVSATLNSDGSGIVYYANVNAAFYSKQNVDASETGWNSQYLSSDGCVSDHSHSTEEPWNNLPCTNYECRRNVTYIGFFDGTENSVVGPVVLPTENESNPPCDFTLRNGETLDVTWVIFDEHDNPTINFYDASGDGSTPLVTLNVNETALRNAATSSEVVTYEYIYVDGVPYYITKRAKEGIVSLNVDGADYKFPITVTEVYGDKRGSITSFIGLEPGTHYTTYTISLDCMMTRADYSGTGVKYNSGRLFDDSPLNIYATLSWGSNTYDATRAIDDPIHFIGTDYQPFDTVNRPCYSYNSTYGKASNLETSTRCVVNTMFGDLNHSDDGLNSDPVSGFRESNDGSYYAVVTSFRHLSNIRMINDTDNKYHFYIVRDLNWYYYEHSETYNLSDVRVYSSSYPAINRINYRYHSPVEGGDPKIVSFPALGELTSNEILSSMPHSTPSGEVENSVINSVQLRAASFNKSRDSAFGLVCLNSGNIYNIYTNNLNLVMNEKSTDGIACDYSGGNDINGENYISPTDTTITLELEDGRTENNVPVGGLVGLNQGVVGLNPNSTGSSNIVDEGSNTVRMSNCVVMASHYWRIGNYSNGVGGVIGKNVGVVSNESTHRESTYGVIEVTGSFAIVGRNYIGGIIGWNSGAPIGARLVINGKEDNSSEFTLPAVTHLDGNRLSCVIYGRNDVGGAIGCLEGGSFTYNVDSPFSANEVISTNDNGLFSFIQRNNENRHYYQIDVNLPINSLILNKEGDNNYINAGGAIGYMKGCSGNSLSIHVQNNGIIGVVCSASKDSTCGGAIGKEESCSITSIFIDVENNQTSLIGSNRVNQLESGTVQLPRSSGGAIGFISDSNSSITIAVSVNNRGSIFAQGGWDYRGVGGAIGSAGEKVQSTFLIRVINESSSSIRGFTSDSASTQDGTGGAIGAMARHKSGAETALSGNTLIYVENHSMISGVYRVGGAIGTGPTISRGCKIYAVNDNAKITGTGDFIGGNIGCLRNRQSGTVQAVLTNGTVISGENYVGGTAGTLQNYSNDGKTITWVRSVDDDSGNILKVTGTGSFVGGVCGDVNRWDPVGTIIDPSDEENELVPGTDRYNYEYNYGVNRGTIWLRGDNSDNLCLNVTGGTGSSDFGVGGLIGIFRSSKRPLSSEIKAPTQLSGDRLIVNVDGGSSVGGAIGQMRSCNVDEAYTVERIRESGLSNIAMLTDVSVVLRPESHITGSGNDVGGAIGGVYASSNVFEGRIQVSVATGDVTSNSGIKGSYNVGGAVGHFNNIYPVNNNNNSNNSSVAVNFTGAEYSITSTISSGDANTGGVIGLIDGTTTQTYYVPSITADMGSTSINAEGDNVGGAIGKVALKNGSRVLFNNQITVSSSGEIQGYSNVGGAIGYNDSYLGNNNTSNFITTTINNDCSVVGNGSNVGGVIGYNNGIVNGKVSSTISGSVNGTGNVGGIIGTNNAVVYGQTVLTINGTGSVNGIGENSGDNVGGVIGDNKSTINSIQYTFKASGKITGRHSVGGVIGYNESSGTLNTALTITVDGRIEATGSNVGGVIGNSEGVVNGNLTITINGYIEGKENTGGVIGRNNKTIDYELTSTIKGNGISGTSQNVGGVIGLNCVPINKQIKTTVNALINGGSNVGGAIGKNENSVSVISVTMNGGDRIKGNNSVGGMIGNNSGTLTSDLSITVVGNIIGAGNDVGGVIGTNTGSIGVSLAANITNGRVEGGENNVGGAIGRNNGSVATIAVTTSNSGEKIKGKNSVGGLIGLNDNDGTLTTDLSITITTTIKGTGNDVGGVIGTNNGSISVGLTAIINGKVEGGDSNVGGAIGRNDRNGSINAVITVTMGNNDRIVGKNSVGGMIGCNDGALNTPLAITITGNIKGNNGSDVGGVIGTNNGTISVDLTAVITTTGKVIGANNTDNVGGAVGRNNGSVSNITVTMSSGERISGRNSVGGMIGYNNGTLEHSLNITIDGTIKGSGSGTGGIIGTNNGTINDSLTATIVGTVQGGNTVGGAIGQNTKSIGSTVTIATTINGTVTGGTDIGGVIGMSTASVSNMTVSLVSSGMVKGSQAVGGIIGNNAGTLSYPLDVTIYGTIYATSINAGGVIGINNGTIDKDITATINGTVKGGQNAGGIMGRNSMSIGDSVSLTSNVNGTIQGSRRIGGAVGNNEGQINGNITVVLNNATISGTEQNIGGAIGNNNAEVYGLFVTIDNDSSISGVNNVGGVIGLNDNGSINGNIIFEVHGTINGSGNGIGGVIGRNNGNIFGEINATVIGSVVGHENVGGVIGYINNKDKVTNSVSAILTDTGKVHGNSNAQSIGGVIGRIDNGTVNHIYIMLGGSIDGEDNSQYLGGAIGRISGGTVNDGLILEYSDYGINGYSGVGGAIGYMSGGTVNDGITETFENSYVTGHERVGGAIGYMSGGTLSGGINLEFNNGTYIGDVWGNSDEYDCIDVGGAIGHLQGGTIKNGIIRVVIDETSMVFAGGVNTDDSVACGVGGAFGRVGTSSNSPSINTGVTSNTEPYVSVYCDHSHVAVCSLSSPVGGIVGRMMRGTITRSYSTAIVSGSDYVGGFVGRMDGGSITSSYSSGHTINGGSYDPDNANITGNNYVGGFAGFIGADVSELKECYSTASVRGNNYIGGFVGCVSNNKANVFKKAYCTGLVSINTDPNVDQWCGAFAGYIEGDNAINLFQDNPSVNTIHSPNDGNKVLRDSNPSMNRVGNISDADIPDSRLCWSEFSLREWGGHYIRVQRQSSYNAVPFDSELAQYANNFPYRTYISYPLNDGTQSYFGEHIGDWPIYETADVITVLNNDNTAVTSSIQSVNFRYGESNGFTLPITSFTVIYIDPDTGVSTTLTQYDYRVMYSDNTHAGTASYRVVGSVTGGYSGEVTNSDQTFQINPVNLENDYQDGIITITINNVDDIYYTGEVIEPTFTATYYNSSTKKNVNIPLTDFDVTYENNTNAGTGYIVITGIHDCTGTIRIPFVIKPAAITADMVSLILPEDSDVAVYPYTSPAVTPGVTVTFNNTTLVVVDDYTLEYHDNGAAGSAYIDVIGTGNFATDPESPIRLTFEIRYTATFSYDEGSSSTVMADSNGLITAPVPLPRDGYRFDGWSETQGGTIPFEFTSTELTGNINLYPIWWQPTVTFDFANGDEAYSTFVAIGQTVASPADPSRDGYTFNGWATSDGTQYDPLATVEDDITYIAQWTLIEVVDPDPEDDGNGGDTDNETGGGEQQPTDALPASDESTPDPSTEPDNTTD